MGKQYNVITHISIVNILVATNDHINNLNIY